MYTMSMIHVPVRSRFGSGLRGVRGSVRVARAWLRPLPRYPQLVTTYTRAPAAAAGTRDVQTTVLLLVVSVCDVCMSVSPEPMGV